MPEHPSPLKQDPLRSPPITTRTGDDGWTKLRSCRYPKDHPRIELLGELDLLTSYLGLAKSLCMPGVFEPLDFLQDDLYQLMSEVSEYGPWVDSSKIEELEQAVEEIRRLLPIPRKFIKPGATTASAHLDVARTHARTAERRAVTLEREESGAVPTLEGGLRHEVCLWLNRLSDYLFVLGRLEDYLWEVPPEIMERNKHDRDPHSCARNR